MLHMVVVVSELQPVAMNNSRWSAATNLHYKTSLDPAVPQSRSPLRSFFILYSVSDSSTYKVYCQSTLTSSSTSTKLIAHVIPVRIALLLAEHLCNGTSYESAARVSES